MNAYDYPWTGTVLSFAVKWGLVNRHGLSSATVGRVSLNPGLNVFFRGNFTGTEFFIDEIGKLSLEPDNDCGWNDVPKSAREKLAMLAAQIKLLE